MTTAEYAVLAMTPLALVGLAWLVDVWADIIRARLDPPDDELEARRRHPSARPCPHCLGTGDQK